MKKTGENLEGKENNYYLCTVFDSKHCFIILKFKEMKKVFFSLAVVCSLALVSCGGNKAAEATDSESVAAEVVEESVVAPGDSETAVVEAAEVVEAPVADSAK